VALIPFTLVDEKRAKDVDKPPKDPLERAHWVHSVLCEELFEVLNDHSLVTEDRREMVLKFSAKIVSATPHNDLHAARKDLREREKGTASSQVGGALTRGSVSQSGSLRSSAPKRGKPKK